VKGRGKPKQVPTLITAQQREKACLLSNPPIFVKTTPPRITPKTGPVIAAIEKYMVAYCFV
jgi:hypothetical protein